jgi:hypothetical protein
MTETHMRQHRNPYATTPKNLAGAGIDVRRCPDALGPRKALQVYLPMPIIQVHAWHLGARLPRLASRCTPLTWVSAACPCLSSRFTPPSRCRPPTLVSRCTSAT